MVIIMEKLLRNKFAIFWLVFPGFAIFAFAALVPIICSIYFGMTEYRAGLNLDFIGLQNFKEILFNDKVFWKSLINNLYIGLSLVFIQHPMALGFAILLDKVGGKAEKFFRAAYFTPAVISITVTCAMWVNMMNPEFGFINQLLDMIGLGRLKMDWLGDPRSSLLSIIFIIMWSGFGWAVLLYYAGVKGLPEDVYEAARIDGSSGLHSFIKITIPLLTPIISVNITFAIISALKTMTVVYLTTNGSVGDTTQVVANYLYKQAFTSNRYGYGNAMSVLFVIICMIATILLNKLSKNKENEY